MSTAQEKVQLADQRLGSWHRPMQPGRKRRKESGSPKWPFVLAAIVAWVIIILALPK